MWVQLGAALAAGVLLRQVVIAVVPIVVLWAWWRARAGQAGAGTAGGRLSRPTLGAIAAVLVIAAAVLPWTTRNYGVFGRFVLLNTNAGFACFWGNHPIHGTHFVPILPEGTYARLIPDELRGTDEATLERALMRRALAIVFEDPARFVRLSASRVTEYVKFWPSRDSGRASNVARVLSFGICLPFILGGVIVALAPSSRGASPRWPRMDRRRPGCCSRSPSSMRSCTSSAGRWFGIVFLSTPS